MSVATLEKPRLQTTSFDFRSTKLGETIGALSFDPIEADRLARLDVEERRRELSKNLEGFKGEVLDDIPVSHLYHYYYDQWGNVYSHPDKKDIHRFEHQFDSRERDGLPALGFKKATNMLREHPGSTVFWYSPPGRATQDHSPTNPYAEVNFIYGQLYVMNFDGEKINGVAVKVDREGEEAISQFMPDRFDGADRLSSDYARIEYFLQNPSLLAGTINELTQHTWTNGRVYGGKEGGIARQNFTVHEMLTDIEKRFNRTDQTSDMRNLVDRLTPSQLTDRQEVARLYLQMIIDHPSMRSQGTVSLKGACGGSEVTRSEIETLLGVGRFEPTSSAFRLVTQTDLRQLFSPELHSSNQTHFEDYKCPHCNKTLSGESKTDKSSWRKKCDHCQGALGC